MRYKLICSNKEGSFTIREEEVEKLIKASRKNQPAIFQEGIVLNWNMYSGLVEDKERLALIAEHKRNGLEIDEPSPFAKLLSGKMTMLSNKSRTEAQTEAAREERKLK